MMDTFLIWSAYAWFGWGTSTLLLIALYFLTGYLGIRTFNRLLRIYQLETIGYWLREMEKNGTHAPSRAAQAALKEKLRVQKETVPNSDFLI